MSHLKLQILILPPVPRNPHFPTQSLLYLGKWRTNPCKAHEREEYVTFNQHCEACSTAIQPVHGARPKLI